MSNAAKKQQHSNDKVADWTQRLRSLVGQVKQWAKQENWPVSEDTKIISEQYVGAYEAPVLRIQTPEGEIRVEPVALRVAGADGRVDLTAWPSLNRVKLVIDDGAWRVYTDSNIPWPKPWSRKTFVEIARELAASR